MAKFTPLGKRGEARSGDPNKSRGSLNRNKLSASNAGSNNTASGAPTPNPYTGSSTQTGDMSSHRKSQGPGSASPMSGKPASSADHGSSGGNLQQYKPSPDGYGANNTASGTPTGNPYAGSSTRPEEMDRYTKDQNLSDDRPMQQAKPVYDDQADPNLSGNTFDPGKYSNNGTNTAAGTPDANPYTDGGSSTRPGDMSRHSKKPRGSGDLKSGEEAAGSGAKGIVGKAEKGLIGDGLNVADKFLPPSAKLALALSSAGAALFGSKKKKAGAGGIVGVIAAVFMFGAFIGVGPLKIIHLSQILQKAHFGNENDSSIGMRGLIRFARTGNIGETRVGALGSAMVKRTTAKLTVAGFDFGETNKMTNGIRGVTVDTDVNKNTIGIATMEERKASFLKNYPFLDATDVDIDGKFLKIKLDPSTFNGSKIVDLFYTTSIREAADGTLLNALRIREFKIFYNQPGLLSPVTRYFKTKQERLANNRSDRQKAKAAAKAAGEERYAKFKQSKVGIKGAAAKAGLKETLNSKRTGLSIALTFTAAACIIREIRGFSTQADRADVALATVETTHQMAKGANVTDGRLLAADPGDWGYALEDDTGRDVFGGRALQALSGKVKPSGEDLSDEEKGIFSLKGQSDVDAIADSVGDTVCSTPGLIAQGILGVGLIWAAPPVGWTAKVLIAGSSAAATTVVLGQVMNRAEKAAADKVTFEAPLAGPRGGNVLAWASKAGAGTAARSVGGIERTPAASAVLEKEQKLASQQEFRAKSFSGRIFDVYDHRSVASSFIDSSSTDPGQNITNIATSLANINTFATGLFPAFSPVAHAAGPDYDWSALPDYGIPGDLFDDPAYQDPYDNADKAAGILSSTGDKYPKRALNCFGVIISKDSGLWDVVPDDETDPRSPEYRDGKCDDLSDPNWKRIILFVFYTGKMKEVTCYDGNPDDPDTIATCKELGYDPAPSAAASTTTGGAGATVDITDLGKSSDNLSCAAGTNDLGVVTSQYSGEFKKESGPLKLRLCEIPDIPGEGQDPNGTKTHGGAVVEARVSGGWSALAKKAKDDGVNLSSSSSFRLPDSCQGSGTGVQCATPGGSPHQAGWAIDFADMGGFEANGQQVCSARMTHDGPQYKWMRENSEDFGIKQYSAESWHWDFAPMANRCGK